MNYSSELYLKSTLASPDYIGTYVAEPFLLSGYPHPLVLQEGGWDITRDAHFTLFSLLLVSETKNTLVFCRSPPSPSNSFPSAEHTHSLSLSDSDSDTPATSFTTTQHYTEPRPHSYTVVSSGCTARKRTKPGKNSGASNGFKLTTSNSGRLERNAVSYM